MGVYIPYVRLPSAYQEVEWIQSSGTQYFILGNQFKTSYKSVIDLQMVTIGGDQVPVGVREIISGTEYRYGINAYSSNFKVISGGSSWSNTKSEDTNRHTITLNQSTATVDGTNYSCSYVDSTFNKGLGVFCYNDVDRPWYIASMKMYKLDIYDENGVHIYDLVPCYRKSDNVIGLYDLVNNQFYTNSGTGTFSKGNDINYVEHPLKNAYIGEYGWTPGANTVAYRPLNSTTTVNDQSGNNYNLTQTGGSFGTYSGVDCFYNGGSTTGYFNLTSAPLIPSGNASRTISLWTNFSSLGSRYVLSYGSQNGTGGGLNLQTYSTSYSFVNIIGKTLRGPDISTGVRYLHTITTEGNEIKYYVNGVLQATNTDTTINTNAITSSLPFRLMRVNNSTSTSYQTRGYLSEVIIENRTWTATEIANYFNDNKEKYGL